MNFRLKRKKKKGKPPRKSPAHLTGQSRALLWPRSSVLRSPSPPSSSSHFTIHISLGFQFHSSPIVGDAFNSRNRSPIQA
ncbi:hypothetical protein SDJN02_06810, partial [Cucurbita argyrosperma subsp. argyrosperma]